MAFQLHGGKCVVVSVYLTKCVFSFTFAGNWEEESFAGFRFKASI